MLRVSKHVGKGQRSPFETLRVTPLYSNSNLNVEDSVLQNMKDDQIEVFRINILLKLLNYLLVSIILIIIALFSHAYIKTAISFGIGIVMLVLLFSLFSLNLKEIKVIKDEQKVIFILSRFLVFNKSIELYSNEFSFSYRSEIGARGSTRMVLTIYNTNEDKILQIVPFSSGWDENKILQITFLLREIGIAESK